MCRSNTTTYCCICGLPFSQLDIDPEIRASPYSYDAELLSADDTDWLRHGNAVDQHTFSDDEAVAELKGLDGIHSLVQQIESIESSRHGALNKLYVGSESDGPVYAMHTTCITIAERVRRHQQFPATHPAPSPATVLQNLYASLKRLNYRTASPHHSVRWEHGYYGAARFWRNFWGQERGWEWLCADPTNIPNLTPWILSQLEPVSSDQPPAVHFPTDDTSKPYPRPSLDGMPIDILHRITSFLPAPSTLRLRRSSRALANRLPLTQSFWREGLISGDLVPFLWDLDGAACRQHDRQPPTTENPTDTPKQWDWRALAHRLRPPHRLLQAALRATLSHRPVEGYGIGYLDVYRAVAAQDVEFGDAAGAPLGLLNRARICQVVADVAGVEEEELHDCHAPLSEEEEVYAAMWMVQVQRPEVFDEYEIRRSLELWGDLRGVEVEQWGGRVRCRL